MNQSSVAHAYVQNQPMSSWNDDPFNLKGSFAGVANMNHQRNLTNYAEELVAHYAKYECEQYELTLDMVPEDEQNELVRLFLESTGRELTECVNGNDFSIDNDYTCALLAMLKDNNTETQAHFAQVTRNNIITYYKDSLEETLTQACDSYLHASMNEAGYYANQDREHGDIVWGKF